MTGVAPPTPGAAAGSYAPPGAGDAANAPAGGYANPGDHAPGQSPGHAPSRAPGFAWSDGPTTVAEAVRLFERTCLGTLPSFAGAGALLDGLGFERYPQMLMRNHAAKRVSALAMSRPDLDAGGARTCAIIADGLDQAAVARAVEPLVAARLGAGATRHVNPELGIAHVVWTKPEVGRYTKVIVTESDTAAFMGVTVMPFDGSTRP